MLTGENTEQGDVASSNFAKNQATFSDIKIFVDGKQVDMGAYNIKDSNYFKLRDIAKALNETKNQFDVAYNESSNIIELKKGEVYRVDTDYTIIDGEAKMIDKADKEAKQTTSTVLVNGQNESFTAYNIAENNYFSIRDLGEKIGFTVSWNEADSSISITTK